MDGDRVYFVNHRCEVVCLDVHGAAAGGPPPAADGSTAKVLWVFDMWDVRRAAVATPATARR